MVKAEYFRILVHIKFSIFILYNSIIINQKLYIKSIIYRRKKHKFYIFYN
jgi:hypothetical protein